VTSREKIMRFVREALRLAESATVEITPLSGRGSDRAFFRVTWDKTNSLVTMLSNSSCLWKILEIMTSGR
jgi:hypothetical protein